MIVTGLGREDRKLVSWAFYFISEEVRMSSSWTQSIQTHCLEYSNAVQLSSLMHAFASLIFPWTWFGWILQNVFCLVLSLNYYFFLIWKRWRGRMNLSDLGIDIEMLGTGRFSTTWVYLIREWVCLEELLVFTLFPYTPVILLQYDQGK